MSDKAPVSIEMAKRLASMSTPIPEWAMTAAKAARTGMCITDECTFDRGCGCLESIARALMAEREACAVTAEKCGSRADRFMKERLESHSIDFQRFAEGCASAASAIRDRSKT